MDTQYWINKGGKQTGPHSFEELQQMSLDNNTYIWYSGMDDWKKIAEVPELAHLVAAEETPTEEEAVMEETPAKAEETPVVEKEVAQQPAAPPAYTAPEPIPYAAPAYQQPAPNEPCPPTNLVWAIILTVLCCVPFGVAGIVFATMVKKQYNMGNMEKAKKYSEWSAWCCILSVVCSILAMPFQFFLI